ncbi:MAG: hypothetical protein JWM86_2771 [Thermoleophilia bacterium]|nr:hypothetical protein [Thermoleophilia bacterium]
MATTSTPPAKARPSGWWYALAPVILMAGVVLAIQAGFEEVGAVTDSFQRLGPDGTAAISADGGDRVSVWAVYASSSGADAAPRPAATVRVTGDDGPVPVRTAGSGSRTTYELGSESGIEVASFVPPTDGRYVVTVAIDTPTGAVAVPTAAVGALDIVGGITRVLRPVGLSILAMFGWIALLMVLRGMSRRRGRGLGDATGPVAATPAPPAGSGPFL